MKKLILNLILLFIGSSLFGQIQSNQPDSVIVTFSIFPPVGKSNIRVDGNILLVNPDERTVKLAPGEHRIELWAYEYIYVDTVINVVEGNRMFFKKRLELNPELLKFRDEYQEFQVAELREKLKYRLPNFIAGGALLGGIGTYASTIKFNDKVSDLRVRYYDETDATEIGNIKSDLEKLKRSTIIRRSTSYVLLGVAVVSSVYGIIAKKKYKENFVPNKAPTYENDSPFNLGFGGELNNQSIQLTYKF